MIKTLIIEDEAAAASRLEKMLLRLNPEIRVIGHLDSVEASVKWFQTNPPPDLLMLDIQLGDGLSFDIFRKVKVDSFVVFTTAYDEYAIKAFELNSVDYLLKPVDEDKLRMSLEKFTALSQHKSPVDIQKVIEMIEGRKASYKKRFVVSIADKIKTIETQEAAWFYSFEKSTFLCTRDNIHYPLEFSLDQLEVLLDSDVFFRISRQYIINISAIAKIHILSKSRIRIDSIPASKDEMMVSSARTPEFRKWLDK
jgi:two-component system, LytTR family, response regulator LytT